MFKQITISMMALGLLSLPAFAQNTYGPAGTGSQFSPTAPTPYQARQMAPQNNSIAPVGSTFLPQPLTRNAHGVNGPSLYPASTTQFGIAPGVAIPVQSLPATTLDSLIMNTANAQNVYGDEGTGVAGPGNMPPISGFTQANTIGANLIEPNLTTGHPSNLPSAWTDTQYMLGGTSTGTPTSMSSAYPGGNLTNSLINAGAASLMNSILPANNGMMSSYTPTGVSNSGLFNTGAPTGAPSSIAQQSYAANTAAFNSMNQITPAQLQGATSPPIPQYSPANNVAAPTPAPAAPDPTAPTFSTGSFFDSNGN